MNQLPLLTAIILGVNEAGLVIARSLKDGVQLKDIEEVYNAYKKDPEVKEKVDGAFKAIKAGGLKAELKTINVASGLKLAATVVEFIEPWKAALKKEEVLAADLPVLAAAEPVVAETGASQASVS